MKRSRRLIRRTILLIGIASVGTALPVGTSTIAANEPPWLTAPGGFPLFDLTGIAPGDSGSATLTVTNPQSFPVTLSMSIAAVQDDDNGCNEPERASGDTTCGAGGGELQFDLRVTLASVDGTNGTDTPIAAATVAGWRAQAAVDPVVLERHESRAYRVGYELPIGSSNLTQSDLVAFEFELRLDQQGEAEAVVAVDAPTAMIGATADLPATGGAAGTDVQTVALIGLSTGLVGFGLHRLSTARRQAT